MQKPRSFLVNKLFFHAAERKSRPWHVIVAVDQSGSMLDSAIFSAVMASIFAELPAVRTSMFLFDTDIADLSDKVGQPVDVLLSIQLGGGTDIAKALQYANQTGGTAGADHRRADHRFFTKAGRIAT